MDPATKEAAFGVMMASLPLGGMPSLQRNVMGGLEILTKQLYLVHKVSLAQEDIDKINVGVQELDTSNAFPEFVHYFGQMSEATLKEYPVASDKESQDMLAESDETLRKIAAGESGKSGYEIAEFFACRLAQEMSGFKREGIQELGDKTLMSLTKWRYME